MSAVPLDRIEIRRLLLEAVQTAGQITTRELTSALPAKQAIVNVPCSTACRQTSRWSATETVLEHHRTWHRIRTPHTRADIYRHLRALELEGQIRRERAAGQRNVRWVAPGEQLVIDEQLEDSDHSNTYLPATNVQTRIATKGRL